MSRLENPIDRFHQSVSRPTRRCLALVVSTVLGVALYPYCASSSAGGFGNSYRAHIGDFDNDGLTDDLYVRQIPQELLSQDAILTRIAQASAVGPIVLIGQHSGTFTLESDLLPSELVTLDSWPAIDVDVVSGDFNIDGVIDILLEGLTAAGLGSMDHFVFAPITQGATPSSIKALDTETKEFFEQVSKVVYNPNHFSENAPLAASPSTVRELRVFAEHCQTPAWVARNGPLSALPPVRLRVDVTLQALQQRNETLITSCKKVGKTIIHFDLVAIQYEIPLGYPDFRDFNQDAVDIAPYIYQAMKSAVPIGGAEKSAIRVILERVLEVDVFGADLNSGYASRTLFEVISYLGGRRR